MGIAASRLSSPHARQLSAFPRLKHHRCQKPTVSDNIDSTVNRHQIDSRHNDCCIRDDNSTRVKTLRKVLIKNKLTVWLACQGLGPNSVSSPALPVDSVASVEIQHQRKLADSRYGNAESPSTQDKHCNEGKVSNNSLLLQVKKTHNSLGNKAFRAQCDLQVSLRYTIGSRPRINQMIEK